MSAYPLLFSPLKIKNMVVPNRIFMPPMGSNLANIDGTPSARHIQYYALRAEGGAGLITVENVCIDYPLGTNGTTQLRLDNDQYLPTFYALVEAMHAHGACVSVQINHAGSSAWPGRLEGRQPVSASAIPTKSGALCHELTVDEIHGIVAKYGEGALRAKRAGCDCVEIHAGHMYLASQFFSPLTNHRTDEFGGSPENRARFAMLVAKEVRRCVGPQFPVVIRVSADEMIPGGNTLNDTLHMLEFLVDDVDIINVSAALPGSIEFQIDKMSLEDGWRAYMAKAVRDKFHKPVVTTGNIRNPEVAERLLAEGYTDLVGIGRGLIADPFWPRKAAEGKEALIRRCISCNIGCADNRIASAKPLRCSVNPDIFNADPTPCSVNPKAPRVLVIGGGVAGLEAACSAAEKGCQVRVLEKASTVGGLAGQICTFPAKYRIGWHVEYLQARAATLPNLEVCLNAQADKDTVAKFEPNLLITATGSEPFLPPIAGLHEALQASDPKVFTITGLMDNLERFKNIPASRIVVIGGGAVGLDAVEFFAEMEEAHHTISLVEMLPEVGRDLDMITKQVMLKIVRDNNVTTHVNTKLMAVHADSMEMLAGNTRFVLDFDYAFICLGMKAIPFSPDVELWCRENAVECLRVGDAKAARRIIDAAQEGRAVANCVARLTR